MGVMMPKSKGGRRTKSTSFLKGLPPCWSGLVEAVGLSGGLHQKSTWSLPPLLFDGNDA